MKILDQLTNPALLDWFKKLGSAWSKPASPATSSTPAPNTSTPAEKTPAVQPAASQSETGGALAALLDLIAKR
jgi:hypothetical protein